MSPVVRRLLVLLVVLAAAVGVPAATATATSTPATTPTADLAAPDSVVLVGAAGLAWTDVDPAVTPVLAGLADDGATGSMTVRAVRSRSCAVDGWLTLSAGVRAADLPGPCRTPGEVAVDGSVPDWVDYAVAAGKDPYGARPGLLGTTLRRSDVCVEAVGPGAAIGAAEERGRVTLYATDLPDTLDCTVTLVDAGTLPAEGPTRTQALERLDALVGDVLDRIPSGARVVVAGIGDGDSPVRPRAVVVSGAGPGELTSSSTRQPGLLQLQDLTATLLTWYATDPEPVTGRPVSVVPDEASGAERISDAQGFEIRAGTLRSVSPQVTGVLAAGFALWCALVAALTWTGGAQRRLPSWLAGAGVAVASVPAATFLANLVPWWDAGAPALAFVGVLALVVAALTAASMVAARRLPLGATLVVGAVGAVVLLADVLTGSRLQLASVFGQNPTVGGRFYGFGNTSFAVYGAGVLVVVLAVASMRRVPRVVAVLGAAAVLVGALAVEAHPSLGADFGGPPGLLLGGLVVLAVAAGVRLTPGRALAALVGAGVLTVGVAVLDWLRPPGDRTHLGEFVQTVLDGGAGAVIGRKLAQNVANLGVPALVVIAVGALVVGLARWRTRWRPAPGGAVLLRAAAVMGVVAFAINDSGLVIPTFVAVVLLPPLVADSRRPSG